MDRTKANRVLALAAEHDWKYDDVEEVKRYLREYGYVLLEKGNIAVARGLPSPTVQTVLTDDYEWAETMGDIASGGTPPPPPGKGWHFVEEVRSGRQVAYRWRRKLA